jgi:adenine-specific DNA-methyltransferase
MTMADNVVMNQISVTSPDVRKERLLALKKLFPDLFDSEGNLDKSELENLVDGYSVSQVEKFQFTWAGKMQSKKNAFTPSKAALKADKERSVNFDQTQNLIIEGDNLEVLKLLQSSYFNKVKCIYIDPPYNTGKDFIYSDDFSEGKKAYWEKNGIVLDGVRLDSNMESVGRYHSNWLDMMQSRLLLCRNLLKEDGVVFVSIDDHEVHNLRKLMDEIFGEENFVAQITLLCNPKGRAQDKHFATNHEYVMVYSKEPLPKGAFNISKEVEQINVEYTEEDDIDKYRTLELRNTHREFGKHNRKNLYYPLYVDAETGEVSLDFKETAVKVLPDWDDGFEGCWTWGEPKAKSEIDFLIGKKVNGGDKWKIYVKDYANGATKMLKTIFHNKSFYTEKGQKTFNSLFETKNKIFQSPKAIDLIMQLIRTTSLGNDIILDFFAGSGSTAHAVMELNKEDDENRKFILVQIPEYTDEKSEAYKSGFKTISDICIERVKRAGDKIKQENAKVDTGFKVFDLTYSEFKENHFNVDPEKTDEENMKAFDEYLAQANQSTMFQFDFEKLLYEVALKHGFELNFTSSALTEFDKNKVLKIQDAYKEALICLDEKIDMETIEKLTPYSEKQFICLKRALDTTKKWTLNNSFKRNLWVV